MIGNSSDEVDHGAAHDGREKVSADVGNLDLARKILGK